jgi:nitroreductase
MQLNEVIASRQSVRHFHPDREVSPSQEQALLEAAVRAPSAGNVQPWHFYAVRDAHLRQALAAAAFGQSFVAQAPLVIVVCADADRSATRYGDRGRTLYCFQDTAAAITNMQLTAVDLGLGTCWIGAFDETLAAEALGLPANLRPVAMLPIGYPAQLATLRPRRPLSEVSTRR